MARTPDLTATLNRWLWTTSNWG